MRIPEYEVYQRRSLHWAIRWGIRVVVWFVMSLVLLLGWWANYVFVNVKPFEVLHSGEHWISWEQLSPEARGFAEVRWDRPYAELARYGADWPDRHDHLLVVGSIVIYQFTLTPESARELLMNQCIPWNVAEEFRTGSYSAPPPREISLEDLLRCTRTPEWELKWALSDLVRQGRISEYRQDEILFEFLGQTPPALKPDPTVQELTDEIRWSCRE